MEKDQEFGPAYELQEKARTSSNNQQISGVKYVPLSEKDQAQVEDLFKVN